MKYIKITTPENIEIEYRLAGVAARLAAAVIDTLIQCLIALIVVLSAIGIVGTSIFQASFLQDVTSSSVFWVLGIGLILLFLIYYGYYVVCEMAMNGQTVGKKVYGLRAIRTNGQPITFTQSLSRNLFRYLIDVMFVGMFTIIFSKKNRRVGDMIAGTIVVDEGEKFKEEQINIDYLASPQAQLASKYQLTHEEYTVIGEYLHRRNKFEDGGVKIRKQIEQLFLFKFGVQEVTDDFLMDVLKN